jgi:predicted phosphodiesterase
MTIRILQLSDIHFSTKHDDEVIEHDDVRTQLFYDLRNEVIPRLGNADAVLIAGDIAFSGKQEEYERAASWLETITSACGCKRTDVLTVPGNHDVDRRRVGAAAKMLHRRLRSSGLPEATRELTELIETHDGSLIDKLSDYQAFAASYGCHFKSPSRPHWERHFALDGAFRLNFIGLTTVLVCDAEDQIGSLLLGKSQYIIDRPPCVEQVVVMHHPLEWLKDGRQAHDYLHSRARILIFGHEHYQHINQVTGSGGEDRLVIGSGAVTPDSAADPYIYRYNILEFSRVDIEGSPGLAVTVHPRLWVRERTCFEADTLRLSGQQSTTFRLRCPQFSLSHPPADGSAIPDAAANDVFVRLSYFYWRYLDWKQRLTVLVQADILPHSHPSTLLSLGEHGLRRAQRENKLRHLWDVIMSMLPADKREPNPL